MAAVLGMYLKNAGHDIVCESAGIGENAAKGGPASLPAAVAARRIGLNIYGGLHNKRHISQVNLEDYDLIVCAGDEIAGKVIEAGVGMDKIYNAQITNPWPVQFQEDYDKTFEQILAAMYRVVVRYNLGLKDCP